MLFIVKRFLEKLKNPYMQSAQSLEFECNILWCSNDKFVETKVGNVFHKNQKCARQPPDVWNLLGRGRGRNESGNEIGYRDGQRAAGTGKRFNCASTWTWTTWRWHAILKRRMPYERRKAEVYMSCIGDLPQPCGYPNLTPSVALLSAFSSSSSSLSYRFPVICS